MTFVDAELAALTLTTLAGSERTPAPGAIPEGTLDPNATVELTLVVRRRNPLPDPVHRLQRTDFEISYGADPNDAQLVVSHLTRLGLEIREVDVASRRVRASGPVSIVSRVFGTELEAVRSRSGSAAEATVTHRHRTGSLSIPTALDGIVIAVLGLDDRPQARSRIVIAEPGTVATSYTPLQLGEVYGFPADTDGTGETISIVELGGGFEKSDLTTYFKGLGVTEPSVRAMGVDGATNVPGQDPNGADAEVMLDIEVAGALAPGADLLVYFTPNTDAGFLDAVATAAHASPTPAAISISWGQSEDSWTAQARTSLDNAIADAVALGITVTVAAGDDGSADRATDGIPHVDFPASSPHALGCGGTTLQADPSTGAVTSETVWNGGSGDGATGGGVSDVFALPTWQASVGVPAGSGSGGRGVPDVAADADPRTGYQVRVDGRDTVIGGTSAVAPLWAALAARLAQSIGTGLGLAQPTLYAGASAGVSPAGFRDIVAGNNGAYAAAAGWDACTGLGVPVGSALERAFAPGASHTAGPTANPTADPTGQAAEPAPDSSAETGTTGSTE